MLGICSSHAAAQSNHRNAPPPQQAVFMPPVHLVPGNRQQPTPAAPRQTVRSQVAQTAAYVALDNPFEEMEQDLALPQPPADRISQTPARPETRPVSPNQRQAIPSPSVLGQQQSVVGSRESVMQRQTPLSDPHTGLPSSQRPVGQSQNQLRTPAQDVGFGPYPEPVWQEEVVPGSKSTDEQQRMSAEKECGEFRELLLNTPISTVALDISPPRNPRSPELKQTYRDWSDIFGQPICSGTLVDLKRGYAIINTNNGLQKIAYARLSESDLAAISEAWELPKTCLVSIDPFGGRCWMPQTMTWHAANLCHKPLYFEDVQLERYGHSDGPFMQPLRSGAHFLVSLATLPYQTGINPPNECQYALGYYRPGNCAPWLGYPVPISVKGAAHQAAFLLGGGYILF